MYYWGSVVFEGPQSVNEGGKVVCFDFLICTIYLMSTPDRSGVRGLAGPGGRCPLSGLHGGQGVVGGHVGGQEVLRREHVPAPAGVQGGELVDGVPNDLLQGPAIWKEGCPIRDQIVRIETMIDNYIGSQGLMESVGGEHAIRQC